MVIKFSDGGEWLALWVLGRGDDGGTDGGEEEYLRKGGRVSICEGFCFVFHCG